MPTTPDLKETDKNTAVKLGLLEEEFDKVVEILGREPNFTELSIFSAMWSEHCSYKNSIKHLKTLPKEGDNILAEAGEENAGLVDLGDGKACAFKIESHNHPSAIEPYQGAATGVGGINRDIFTMGARPIAQLNSLRFGDPDNKRTKWHVKGAVKGIGDYGNAFGVPVLGGEVLFHPCYNTNPLINAMSVGIVDKNKTISAVAKGEGNPVYIVGSLTGKDGIHGAAFASRDITEESMDDLPAVQVGDPFQEKLLLEATMELADTDLIVGMQDMGAAGITCSTAEMAEAGNSGMDIWLDKVPTRQKDMKGFEILLSESQERMLVVIKKGKEEEVKAIFDKWDLNCEQIGEVTNGNTLNYYYQQEKIAEIPADSLVLGGDAPVYDQKAKKPDYIKRSEKFDINKIEQPEDLSEVAWGLLNNPNVTSRKWVTEQYDTMIGTANMSSNFHSDAGILNLKNTNKALAMTVDCNSRYVQADPHKGTAIAVAEASRNIICSGGIPQAVTNCLNFGNPYDPEAYWQFTEAVKGLGEACEVFETPVTGGNVSFYNQIRNGNNEEPVFPTPVIGMLGLVEDKKNLMSMNLKHKGELIFLIGERKEDISSSEYLVEHHGIENSPAPYFDLREEFIIQQILRALIRNNFINAAHDVSHGGLFISLVEMGLQNGLGFDIMTDSEIREDAFLFGESQGRMLVTVNEDQENDFIDYMASLQKPFVMMGHVTRGKMVVDGQHYGFINEAKDVYEYALEKKMEEE
ncbi:MAG: phosphoribosylformylglycinamidine synthase subunit PurL [Flavobacteriales bacterium]